MRYLVIVKCQFADGRGQEKTYTVNSDSPKLARYDAINEAREEFPNGTNFQVFACCREDIPFKKELES